MMTAYKSGRGGSKAKKFSSLSVEYDSEPESTGLDSSVKYTNLYRN